MNPTWEKDPIVWRELPLREQLRQLRQLRQYYCSGPCGQSASVLASRTALYNGITEAINQLRKLESQ